MNRKVMKVLSVVLMVVMIVVSLMNITYALDDIYPSILTGTADPNTTKVAANIMATIINVFQVVGMGIAVIMLVYVAIKYMSAAPSDKADFKKSATAYIVGAIVLFAASGILQIIKNFATSNIKVVA